MVLATKAGSVLKPTDSLKIAGATPDDISSGISKSRGAASSFMQYGSFSGADIKIVVHYPFDATLQALVEEDKSGYENDLIQIDKQIDDITNSSNTTSQNRLVQLSNQRKGILEQLEITDGYLEDIKGFPTSRVLGEVQTISWGIFREKSPVRTLGSVYPRAYTRGPRTIGGSIIFTVFNEHALHEILSLNLKFYNTGTSDHDKYTYTTNLADQLPPLDISLVFANEYGALSHMGLWGVEFFQEGGTFSVEDIFSENTIQYVCRDLDPMTAVDKRLVDGQGIKEEWSSTGSTLMREKQYRTNHLVRRNQFI
jgi:hypothetical protein